MFDNLFVYPEAEMILDPNVAVVNKAKTKIIREAVADWLEMKRNELVVAFLDGQSSEEV